MQVLLKDVCVELPQVYVLSKCVQCCTESLENVPFSADIVSSDNSSITVNIHSFIKERLDVFEAKIEESEKAGSHQELNPGHLACAANALPLSYDNWTTTIAHNPLCILHRVRFPVTDGLFTFLYFHLQNILSLFILT